MTIQKLLILHGMSSSSDSLRSQKYVEERKMKLKKELEKKKEERVIVRPQVIQVDAIKEELDPGEDEDILPGIEEVPLSSFDDNSMGYRKKIKKFVLNKNKHRAEPMRKPKPPLFAIENNNEGRNMHGRWAQMSCDDINTPSNHIRTLFQASASIDECSTVTSHNRMYNAIEEAQNRVYKDDQNENKDGDENDPSTGAKTVDLRSLYQKYLAGKIEKERVVRTGQEWTSGYREKRKQRGRPNKRVLNRRRTGGSSVTSAPARIQPTKIDEMGFATFL